MRDVIPGVGNSAPMIERSDRSDSHLSRSADRQEARGRVREVKNTVPRAERIHTQTKERVRLAGRREKPGRDSHIDRRSTLIEGRAGREDRSYRERQKETVRVRKEKTKTMGFDPEKGEQNTQWQEQQPHYPVVDQSPAYYGTFQGQPEFPQPVPPSQAPHYAQGDSSYEPQGVRGVHERIVQGRPLLGGEHYQRSTPLPFCGLGFGWFLFIIGFFCLIPWYIGVVIYFCLAHDVREKTGLLACTIASIFCLLAGGTKFGEMW